MATTVAFTGSRALAAAYAALVGAVVAALPAGAAILVGDAPGADALVRRAAPAARVFAVEGVRYPGALVARSVRMVQALAAAGGVRWLVALAGQPCPAGIVPAGAWRSGSPGSGTWSSTALALGLGLGAEVVVICCGPFAPPAWPGGTWVPCGSAWAAAAAPLPAQGYRWVKG